MIARYCETGSHVKGADTEELKSIEDKFKIKFPESYKYFLLQCDGMADECGDVTIYGTRDILMQAEYTDILNKGWIPYSADGMGNTTCVNWENGAANSFDKSLTDLIETVVDMADECF